MGNMNESGYSGSRVLVTGGSGFIGSLLCDRLIHLGAAVHAISRRARNEPAEGIAWRQGDLADRETVDGLFAEIRPDIVFHLASEVTGSRELKLVLPTIRANLLSSVNILVAATEHRCKRLVMAGSLEEPDEADSAVAVPASPYAAAKWSASGYARMFHALYHTPVTIARLFMVYGPGQQDLRKLIPYVTLALLRGESPRLSSGQRPVDWIYVEDVIDGLLAMGMHSAADGCTFNLGSGELVTTRRVVEMLCEIIDTGVAPEFGALPDRPMERIKQADIVNTEQVLGWRPAVALRQGLERTVAWYRGELDAGRSGL
jgi:UDP-glucose 4-epimerase